MRNCVVSFCRAASDTISGIAVPAVKILNSYGLIVSDTFYFSELRALGFFAERLISRYDNIFICGAKGFEAEDCFQAILPGLDRSGNGLYVSAKDYALFYIPQEETAAAEIIKSVIVKVVAGRSDEYFGKTVLKAYSPDPSKIESAAQTAEKLAGERLKIYTSESFGDYKIEIIYNQLTPKFLTDEVIRLFNSQLFDEIYSLNGKSLEETVFDLLSLKKLVLSSAESFTGGGIARKIISYPGASKVFFEGITAYSDRSKQDRLGVGITTLNEFGAVSDQAAYEMAAGLLSTGHCDVAVATTGIAGPDSDGTSKPKGLSYIAVGVKGEIEVFKHHFTGSRQDITSAAVNSALFALLKKIKYSV